MRDFDNLRSAHHWSLENGDADLGLRLVWRPCASTHPAACAAEITSWADAAIGMPDADDHERFPVVVAVAAYGRFARGDLEGAIELGDKPSRPPRGSAWTARDSPNGRSATPGSTATMLCAARSGWIA